MARGSFGALPPRAQNRARGGEAPRAIRVGPNEGDTKMGRGVIRDPNFGGLSKFWGFIRFSAPNTGVYLRKLPISCFICF